MLSYTKRWKKILRCRIPTVKNAFIYVILLCISTNLLFLIYSPSRLFEERCPLALTQKSTNWKGKSGTSTEKSVNCSAIYEGNDASLAAIPPYKWCNRHDVISDGDYVKMTSDCDKFVSQRGYGDHPVSEEETQFPIAFSILMHENVEQTERMLRLIYRPHNVYCIHVDAKAPPGVHEAMNAIARCLPNVKIASRTIQVHWAEFTVLEAELICLNDLWKDNTWKYYINLAASDFPLRTNLELVQILDAYSGGNEIDGSLQRRPIEWTKYSWRREYWRTNTLKSPPPRGFLVAKGSTHVAASRRFIDFALHNEKAQGLLEWMKDIRCPDEHFFQTLNSNPQIGVPGAYRGDPESRDGFHVRYKRWYSPSSVCHGKWVNHICVLASRDLHDALRSRHMFLNKVNLDLDPVAFQCLQQWYEDRVVQGYNEDFDIEFYKSKKLVKNHV